MTNIRIREGVPAESFILYVFDGLRKWSSVGFRCEHE